MQNCDTPRAMKRLVSDDDLVGRYRITGPLIGEGSFSEVRACAHAPRAVAALTAAAQVYPAEDLDTHEMVRLALRRALAAAALRRARAARARWLSRSSATSWTEW